MTPEQRRESQEALNDALHAKNDPAVQRALDNFEASLVAAIANLVVDSADRRREQEELCRTIRTLKVVRRYMMLPIQLDEYDQKMRQTDLEQMELGMERPN